MREREMIQIAELIDRVLKSPQDAKLKSQVREQVRTLVKAFPLYA
jgi:glycine/serine hydroxymethyltransferase